MADKTLREIRTGRFRGSLASEACDANGDALDPQMVQQLQVKLIWEQRTYCEAKMRAKLEEKEARSEIVKRERVELARQRLRRIADTFANKMLQEQERIAQRDSKLMMRVAENEELEEMRTTKHKVISHVEHDNAEHKALIHELHKIEAQKKKEAVTEKEARRLERVQQTQASINEIKTARAQKAAQHREMVRTRLQMIEDEEFAYRQKKLKKMEGKLQRTDETRSEFFNERKAAACEKMKYAGENYSKYSQSYETLRRDRLKRLSEKDVRVQSTLKRSSGRQNLSRAGSVQSKQQRSNDHRERVAQIIEARNLQSNERQRQQDPIE